MDQSRIFERRAYRLKQGQAAAFWALQREWNTPSAYRCILDRLIGYFTPDDGDTDEIIHLYRYDSFADWDARLKQSYAPDRAGYFAAARPLVLEQESGFYGLAPIDRLSPLWTSGADWLPGDAAIDGSGDLSIGRFVEEIVDFRPGGAPRYWQFLEERDPGGRGGTPIAALVSRVGLLNRVIHYCWFGDGAEVSLYGEDRRPAIRFALGDVLRAHTIRSLVPSPIHWLRPLIATGDLQAAAAPTKAEASADG